MTRGGRSPCILMICKKLLKLPELIRFPKSLTREFMGAESDDTCHVVMIGLHELGDRIDKSVCDNNE